MKEMHDGLMKLLNVESRKTISVNLPTEIIEQVDKLIEVMSGLNPSKVISRNSVLECAIETFVKETTSFLKEENGVLNLDQILDKKRSSSITKDNYDLIILPGHNDGFLETFLTEEAWYPFRIKEERISKIKYIAIYRAAPISGISHYGKIDRIEQYKDTIKKIAYLDGPPIDLGRVIKLGSLNANAFRSPRYSHLSKLQTAQNMSQLFE